MIYTEKDIDFTQITPTEFENLCYELIISYGFQSVTWRQGGADSGRDIEARLQFNSPFTTGDFTKWFFECKRYTNGVPVEDLNSKIAWADAGKPDYLVILTTSYITNSAQVWLKQIQSQKNYKIIIIEGVEIKHRLTFFQNLIPKYFSGDKYLKLFHEVKRQKLIYKIEPSFRVLEEIINNIPVEKFDLNDLGFLLTSFYHNYSAMKIACEYSDDFEENLPSPLFERIRQISSQTDISELLVDTSEIGSSGFIFECDMQEYNTVIFQEYLLHLHVSQKEKWALGNYVLIIVDKNCAIELFTFTEKNFETYSFIYSDYNEKILEKILSKLYVNYNGGGDFFEDIKEYCNGIL